MRPIVWGFFRGIFVLGFALGKRKRPRERLGKRNEGLRARDCGAEKKEIEEAVRRNTKKKAWEVATTSARPRHREENYRE